MTAEAGSEDQSMEEILQSIKRIIAEEDDEQPEGEAKAAADAPADESEVEAEAASDPAPMPEPEAEAAPEAAPEPKEEAKPEESSDVLELTEIVQDDGTTVNIEQTEPEPEPKEEVPVELVEQEPAMADETPSDPVGEIISDEAAAASSAALQELANKAPKEAPIEMPKVESPAFRSGNTVEDLVLEALRPMLKEWVDTNLPSMVEAMVQKEIKKISGS